MDTKIIEYIIAIAEEKSLSKAAERLYLTQPALSQRLKKLEEELGTPLFKRENNGLTITDAGRIYINGGQSVLRIKQDALQKIANMKRSTADTLRFGCATSLAMECIPAFREKYPHIELITRRCNTPLAKEALVMGRMDIAVLLTQSLEHSTLEYLPLSKNELLLSLPENHPALSSHRDFQNPEDYEMLCDDYFILSPAPSQSRDMEEQALRQMSIRPRVLCELDNNVSRRYMLNRGLGNGFLPNYTIQKEDTFRTFSLQQPISFFVVAAYPKTITLSEPMKYMLKLLVSIFDAPAVYKN